MTFLISTRSVKQIASSTSKHSILALQSTSSDHSFPYSISFPISIFLSSKMKRNIVDNIIFAFIMMILNISSIYVLRSRRRIISSKILFSIKTNSRCSMSISSHAFSQFIRYSHTLSVYLLMRKTGNLSLHGYRDTEICYSEIYIHIYYFKSYSFINFHFDLLFTSDNRLRSNSQFYS